MENLGIILHFHYVTSIVADSEGRHYLSKINGLVRKTTEMGRILYQWVILHDGKQDAPHFALQSIQFPNSHPSGVKRLAH